MLLSLNIENLSKKFESKWILKNVHLKIYPNENIAILGQNGSGKSTFLKILAGFMHHEKGKVIWYDESAEKELEYPDFTFSSPYIDLFEHLTVKEHVEFHFKQKELLDGISIKNFYELGFFEELQNKEIRRLSSGIKQRFKNTLAILTKSKILFLDEPCSNLDEVNTNRYREMVKKYSKDKMVIIASNNKSEYDDLCTKEFKIENKALNLLRNKQLWA